MSEQVLEIGADWLSLKDAIGYPHALRVAYRIIKGMKDRAKGKLPVLLHCHDMSGASSMCHMMALLAGAGYDRYGAEPAGFRLFTPRRPKRCIAALKDTPFDTGIDLKLLEEPDQDHTGHRGEVFRIHNEVRWCQRSRCSSTRCPAG